MIILTETTEYIAEFEAGILTIARRIDGRAIAMKGKGIAGQFRDCLRTHSPERVIATFLRIAPDKCWHPLYKPGAI